MDKTFDYLYKGITYKVEITYKRMKNITYRFRKGVLLVSAPKRVSDSRIIEGIDKFKDKLFKNGDKKNELNEEGFYLLGVFVKYNEEKTINFQDGSIIKYKDKVDLNKKLKAFSLKLIIPRVRYYEYVMGITKPYNVKVKNMSSRYGSNSLRTRTISFSTLIFQYSIEIIDAIIVHELAHEFQRNHSKKFYEVVLKYYPNYYVQHKKLRKGIFNNGNHNF